MMITLEALQIAKPALEKLLNINMSISTAYKVSKYIKAVNEELKTFDELRLKLLNDVGCTQSEDGTQYIVPEDKQAEFSAKCRELLAIEVSLPEKIDLTGENINITPKMLMNLEPFVIFGE